jgi:hypothetical protein
MNPFSVIPRLDRGIQKVLKITGSPVKPGDDDITSFAIFYKGHFMIPIYKEKL